MTDPQLVECSLAFAIGALIWLFRRGGFRNVLFTPAAFFVLFAYGPVVNALFGQPIYRGIVPNQIASATVGFAIALLGIVFADAIKPQRRVLGGAHVTDRVWRFLPFAYLILIAYAVIEMTWHLPVLLTASGKSEKIHVIGSLHYRYLQVEIFAAAMFFITRPTRLLRRLWTVNFLAFVLYCLLVGERDFLLIGFALLVWRELLANNQRSGRFTFGAIVAVGFAAWFAAARNGQTTNAVGTLNQGSILFIDTYLRYQHTIGVSPGAQLGGTYLNALLNFLAIQRHTSLSVQFAQTYAPGGTVGYGYSLTGEAYLNFGLPGILIIFFLISLVTRAAANRADRSDWWGYFGVVITTVWMYGMRGDSTQVLNTLIESVLFFWLFRVTSTKQRNRLEKDEAQQPTVAAGPDALVVT